MSDDNGVTPFKRPRGRPSGSSKVSFGVVVDLLQRGRAPEGFRRARDLCFEKFDELAARMPAYAVLKLAIELDRHALFHEVSQDKAAATRDAEAYAQFQRYLDGETDVPVGMGLPHAPAEAQAAGDRTDEEASLDGDETS